MPKCGSLAKMGLPVLVCLPWMTQLLLAMLSVVGVSINPDRVAPSFFCLEDF